MKIGILHGFVGGGGGTEKTLIAIVEALIEKKYEISLYTFSKPTIPLPNEVIVHSILPFSFPYFGIYQRYMESELIQKAKNDDIVIQASGGISIPRKKSQKLIIYCHHDFKNEFEKSTTKYKGVWGLYYKPYQWMARKFLENIQNDNIYLISNSIFVQESIKNKFGKQSIVVNPPIDTAEFKKDQKKEKKIITITRYSQEKNLEFALQVMNGIDVTYSIIGNTKTKSNILYYNKLFCMIKNNSKITLYKNISRSRLIEELQSSKIYFHSSAETFGISVIESIAAGCLPIVPDNSAHKETVPFLDLRYGENNISDARQKIQLGLEGKLDHYLRELKVLKLNYNKDKFKKRFIEFLTSI